MRRTFRKKSYKGGFAFRCNVVVVVVVVVVIKVKDIMKEVKDMRDY